MKIRDILIRSGRSLRHAKARTLLTSLAIGVGSFTIILSFAAGAGGRAYVEDIISSNTNTQDLYVQLKQEQIDITKPKKYSEEPTIDYGVYAQNLKALQDKDIEKIKTLSDVEKVSPYYMFSAKYITMEGSDKYLASLETYNASIKLDFIAGGDDGIMADGVIISDTYREAFGYSSAQDMIGKKLQIVVEKGDSDYLNKESKAFEFKVVGVTKKSVMRVSAGSALQLSDNSMKMLNEYNQKGTPMYGSYVQITVTAKEGVDVNKVKTQLSDLGYEAQTAEDMMGFIFQFIDVLQAILIGFGSLAVLTSVFGIINTQYISVLERTQQIGLMKALGMRRRDIGRLFKLEAAWIGFIGGAIGAILAVFGGSIANPYISDYLALGKISLLIFEPMSIFMVIAGLIVVSVLSGVLPARKASKLNPIDALRTE